jgi:hypothetical protein
MISKFSFVVTALFLTTIFLVVIACIPNDKIAVFGQVGTSVGGYLSENTNWTVNNSPYIVEETVIVEPDVALSIEAGVEVRFANGTELIVDGSLTASGNAANNIIFTSNATVPKPGDWGAIRFRETSELEVLNRTRAYVKFRWSFSLLMSANPNNVADIKKGRNIQPANSGITLVETSSII